VPNCIFEQGIENCATVSQATNLKFITGDLFNVVAMYQQSNFSRILHISIQKKKLWLEKKKKKMDYVRVVIASLISAYIKSKNEKKSLPFPKQAKFFY